MYPLMVKSVSFCRNTVPLRDWAERIRNVLNAIQYKYSYASGLVSIKSIFLFQYIAETNLKKQGMCTSSFY